MFHVQCSSIIHYITVIYSLSDYNYLSGDTKAPDKMAEGSVYNLIASLAPEDTKDLKDSLPHIEVGDKAGEILNHALHLASKWKEEKKGDSEN